LPFIVELQRFQIAEKEAFMRAFTNSLRRRLPYLFLALLVAVSLIVLPGMKTLPTVKALEKIPASGKTPFALNMPLGAGSLTLFMPLVGRNPFVFEDNFSTKKGWPDGVSLCKDGDDYEECDHGDDDEVCYFRYSGGAYLISTYDTNVHCIAENPNINLNDGTFQVKLQRTQPSDGEMDALMGFFFGAGDFDDGDNSVDERWEYLAFPNTPSDDDDCDDDQGGFWLNAVEDGKLQDTNHFSCSDRIRAEQNDLMTLTAIRNGEDLRVYASRAGYSTQKGDIDDLDDTDYNLNKGRFYLDILSQDDDTDDGDPLTVKFTYVGIRNDFVVPTP
jgi:hypothetical protein